MRIFTVTCLVLFAFTCRPLIAQNEQQRQRPDAFQRLFTLPGIDFSEEQQAKVEELRKKFLPRLVESQRKGVSILTEEQLQARRAALQKAQRAGKQGRELRDAVSAAVKLTDEQQKQQSALEKEREEIRSEIRAQLTALLTDQQRRRVRQPQDVQQQLPPTHADVKYGPHERNVMDVWLAKSDEPTPVLVSIHGGAFLGGNKSVNPGVLHECLDSGISVAAITYRFSSQAIAPASFRDSARALQFIRHNAMQWNIDPKRVAATGGSAGAGISLWLGFHDDLADPDNDDPVLRELTRLTCMFVNAGQTSYDPRFIRKLFPESDTYKHKALEQLFGVDLDKLDDLPEEKYRLFEECSPLHHLTKDDAPAMLSYGAPLDQPITDQNIGIHHARFGKALKEKMDALNIRCIVNAGGEILGEGESISPMEFLREEFGMTE